jgi:hypothetical protein
VVPAAAEQARLQLQALWDKDLQEVMVVLLLVNGLAVAAVEQELMAHHLSEEMEELAYYPV